VLLHAAELLEVAGQAVVRTIGIFRDHLASEAHDRGEQLDGRVLAILAPAERRLEPFDLREQLVEPSGE